MLCDAVETTEIEVGSVVSWGAAQQCVPRLDWQTVDRALRTIRQRRATLDADEARWLREAEALQIWRPLGMVSAFELRGGPRPERVR